MDLSHWIGSKQKRHPEQEFRFISTVCNKWIWNFGITENEEWQACNQSGKTWTFTSIRERDRFIQYLEDHDYSGPHMPLNFHSDIEWGSPEHDYYDQGLSEFEIARFEEQDDYSYWSGNPDWDD